MYTWLEQAGVAISAITGVLAARGKRVDLFGVLVLAVVTAVGGGTARDLMLGRAPVFWVADPRYLATASVAAFAWFIVARYAEFPRRALLFADAGALALFSVVGAKKALLAGASPAIGVAMGVTTGVVGGILRDTLLGEIPLVFRRDINLYATASLVGALVYTLLRHLEPADDTRNMLLAIAIILVMRFAAIRWSLSLPEYRTPEAEECPDVAPREKPA